VGEQCHAVTKKSPSQERAGDLVPEHTCHFGDATMVEIGDHWHGKTRLFANTFEVHRKICAGLLLGGGTIHVSKILKTLPPLRKIGDEKKVTGAKEMSRHAWPTLLTTYKKNGIL
jgi:hypothetical protein